MVTSTRLHPFTSNKKTLKNNLLQYIISFVSLFLVTAFYLPQGMAQTQGTPGTAGDFEIDANFIRNVLSLKDWRTVLTQTTVLDANGRPFALKGNSTVPGENAFWQVDGNSGIGTEGEVFSGTSNKNLHHIGLGQSPYSITKVNPSTPQKNDLTNIYARSTIFNNKRWVMLAAETRSVDGTSYLDFEYNQAGINVTNTQLIGLGSNGGRTARRDVNGKTLAGDLLFVVDFAKGGEAPEPHVYEWRPTTGKNPSFDWFEITNTAVGAAFIVTNNVDVETAGEMSGFTGAGTPTNITARLQLVEIGVNLTDLGINDDNVCAPSATLTAKTRTSSSYTSELKDFSWFKFSIVPAATMTITAPLTKCETAAAVFEATVAGAGADAAKVEWFKVTGSNPVVETKLTSGITTNGSKSILTISSVSTSDGGNYRAKLVGATCGAPIENTSLTVNATAAMLDLSPQVKCPGSGVTATFTSTVSGAGALAANVDWYSGTTKLANGTKYVITTNNANTISTLTINDVVETDEQTYTAKLTGATCGTPEKSNTLTVNPVPDAKAGTDPAAQCYSTNGNTFQLDGSGSTNGSLKWTIDSKTNTNFNVVFKDGIDNTANPQVIISGSALGGSVTLKLTVTSSATPSCGNSSDLVVVTVSAQPAGPMAEMLPITCNDKFFKLKIKSPEAGVTYTLTQPGNSKAFQPITAALTNQNVVGDVIFEGLVFGDGYSVIANIGDCYTAPSGCADYIEEKEVQRNSKMITENITLEASTPKVSASPNPYNNKIRFTLESNVTGNGSLELYNMLGQKVKTVYQGYIIKGQKKSIEYDVPNSQRNSLIWIFNVGNERSTGKLIGLK